MERKVIKAKFRRRSGTALRVLAGGRTPDAVPRGRGGRDPAPQETRQVDLTKELRDALARGQGIDYKQLRADLDAVADPRPKDWYAWAARTDRHVCLSRLEEV